MMMARLRRGIELPFDFLGRPIRPFHLAVTLACLALFVLDVFLNAGPALATTHWGDFLGAWSGLAAVLLFTGWWLGRDRLADDGLILASGVWFARTVLYLILPSDLITTNRWFAVLNSLAWTVGCLGAWLLESYDHRWRHVDTT